MKTMSRGVTLIELMVVIGIVGLLASIALPSYRAYVMRSNRTDAMTALLRLAAAQEKYYLQNNAYATTPTGVGVANTERGLYTLSLSGVSATGFTATATAPSTSGQYKDTACRSFSITETGAKSATNSGGTAAPIGTCWR